MIIFRLPEPVLGMRSAFTSGWAVHQQGASMLGGIAGQFRAACTAGCPPGRFPHGTGHSGSGGADAFTLGRGVPRSGMPRRLQLRSRLAIEFRGLGEFPDRRACGRGLRIPAVPPLADRPSRGAG